MRRHHRQLLLIIYTLFGVTAIMLLTGGSWFVYQQRQVPATPDTAPDYVAPAYLHEEEAVIIDSATSTSLTILPVAPVLFEYIEVTDGCGVHYEGECVNVRSGPGTEFPVVAQLRNNIVLKVGGQVEHDGVTWYKVIFDEHLRYPERVTSDWYVAADYVRVLYNEGDQTIWDATATTSTTATGTPAKRIVVDRSDQMLYAYEGDILFMETPISTGLALTPTPRGTFTIFKKTPSRYMQGPLPGLPSDQYYDLPGVPWNLYFTHEGAVIHGAYWHNSFGSPYSHGCVNLSPTDAQRLYVWATLGTTVLVQD